MFAVVANTAKGSLLDPNFFLTQFDKSDVYPTLKDATVSVITEQFDSQLKQVPPQLKTQIMNDVKTEFSAAMSTAWFKTQITNVVTHIFQYVKDERPKLDAVISFKDIKPNLVSAIKNIITKDSAYLLNTSVPLSPELLQPVIDQMSSDLEKNIPDTMDLDQQSNMSISQGLSQAKPYIGLFSLICTASIAVVAIFALIIMLLTFSVKKAANKLGWATLWAGVPLVLLSFFLPSMLPSMIPQQATQAPQMQQGGQIDVSGAAGAVVTKILLGLVSAFCDSLKVVSIIVLVAGIALVVVSYLIKEEKK